MDQTGGMLEAGEDPGKESGRRALSPCPVGLQPGANEQLHGGKGVKLGPNGLRARQVYAKRSVMERMTGWSSHQRRSCHESPNAEIFGTSNAGWENWGHFHHPVSASISVCNA